MKRDNKDCILVKDLLPNYIDKLTSKETNAFIEKHIENCTECKKSFENMISNIGLEENYEDTKKIKIFRKINHKIRFLQTIILIILIIFIVLVGRKFTILNRIEDLSEKTNYNNYYQKIVETTDKVISKMEYYQNGDNFFTIYTRISTDNEISKTIEYRYKGEENRYCEINNKKVISEEVTNVKPLIPYQFLNRSILGNLGFSLTPNSLQEIKLYKKDCYLLIVGDYLNFIDKNTGLTIKEINIANNSVIDYDYSFDSVTDLVISDLIKQYIK